ASVRAGAVAAHLLDRFPARPAAFMDWTGPRPGLLTAGDRPGQGGRTHDSDKHELGFFGTLLPIGEGLGILIRQRLRRHARPFLQEVAAEADRHDRNAILKALEELVDLFLTRLAAAVGQALPGDLSIHRPRLTIL